MFPCNELLFLSKESQYACHNDCTVCFRQDTFKRETQYEGTIVSFIGNTCTLIARRISKYRKCGIYRDNAIRSGDRIVVLIGQSGNTDCVSESVDPIRIFVRQTTLIPIFQNSLCKFPVSLRAIHVTAYVCTTHKYISAGLAITGDNALHCRRKCFVISLS